MKFDYTNVKHYLFYFAILLLPFILITNNYLLKKDHYTQKYLEKEKIAYQVILDFYSESAKMFYNSFVNQPDILDVFTTAQTHDKKIRADMRDKLYDLLLSDYNRLCKRGIRQLHFHYANCESFLRFHMPAKYGDNLKNMRYSVVKANTDLVPVTGFEEGRIFNGFRNVFPIVVNGKHLGSVEISMSYTSITDRLDSLSDHRHIFAIKKEVVHDKLFKSEQTNYQASDFSTDYLYESIYNPNESIHQLLQKLNVHKELETGDPFVLEQKYLGEYYSFSFSPVQNIEGDHVAYLITYELDDTFHRYFKTYLIVLISISILLLIIYVVCLRYLRQLRTLSIAKQNLSIGREKYRLVSEHTHNWEYWINTDGNYKYISPACEKICGYSHDSFKKTPSLLFDIVETSFKESVVNHFEHESPVEDYCKLDDFKILTKDGKMKWIEHSCHPVYDDSGRFMGRRGINRDITKQKVAFKKLHDRENKIRSIFKSAPVGIGVVSNRMIQEVNSRFCEMTGYLKEELVGQNAVIVYPSEEEYEWVGKEKYRQIQKYGTGSVETHLKKKSGELIKVVLSSTPLNISDLSEGVTFTALDITEKDKLAEQLRQSQKLEAVGTMVGGISHELNNILQSLFLYGGLVKDDLPENEELQANFDHMLNDGERAKDIVKQILTFSRKTSVDMQPQAMHQLIMETLVLARASLPTNTAIKQDIDMNCGMVLCDKTQIHQVVLNLCNNAQHAMEGSGGVLSISLKQIKSSISNGDPATDVLELTISDTGHGIDPPDLEKVFDPFFTTKQFGKGTGLGLSVIHGIVEMMKGQITVTSEPGRGTTFRILFPVADDVEVSSADAKPESDQEDLKKIILLVDDDDSIRLATQTVLTRKGFTVTSAANGKLAFDLFKANPDEFDIIVTDQSMPKMSGSELTEEIRNSKSKIPIILSTGQLGVEDQKEFKEIGITGFIQKPWTADELIERIQDLDA